jgi:AsmA protein
VAKPIKIMLICIVASILILFSIVYGLLFIINTNDFKPEISAALTNKIGRDITIKGTLKLVLFPKVKLATGAVVIGNPAGFPKFLLSVDDISLRLRPLPLLSKKIDADMIQIRGLKLNLITNQQGINNWGIGIPNTSPTPGRPALATDRSSILMAFSSQGITIENADVNLENQQTGQSLDIKKLNIKTGPIALNTPVISDFTLTAIDKKTQLTASINGQSTITTNSALDIFSLSNTHLNTTITGKAIPLKSVTFTLNGKAVLFDTTQQTVKASDLQLKLAELLVTSDMMASSVKNQPTLSGNVHIMPFNPSHLMEQLALSPPVRRDDKTLRQLAAEFNFHASGDTFNINNLALTLDGSSITGSASINHSAKPTAKFTLAIDTLDLDRYLPAEANNAKPIAPVAVLAQLPVETLRKLHVSGTLSVNKLMVKGSSLRHANLTLNP